MGFFFSRLSYSLLLALRTASGFALYSISRGFLVRQRPERTGRRGNVPGGEQNHLRKQAEISLKERRGRSPQGRGTRDDRPEVFPRGDPSSAAASPPHRDPESGGEPPQTPPPASVRAVPEGSGADPEESGRGEERAPRRRSTLWQSGSKGCRGCGRPGPARRGGGGGGGERGGG